MIRSSHAALQRYKVRRGAPVTSVRPVTRWSRMALMLVIPVAVYAFTRQVLPSGPPDPLTLTYELDLQKAPQGDLTVTMIATGDLPGTLALTLPAGAFGGQNSAVSLGRPEAHILTADGGQGKSLELSGEPGDWRLDTAGAERIGVIYNVVLRSVSGQETDIRKHISAPVNGGVRAAGYEVFLQPANRPIAGITVAVHNPADLPFMAPWPPLLHLRDASFAKPEKIGGADLAPGLGFDPLDGKAGPRKQSRAQRLSEPVPANLLYHPRDLDDMNNALLVCGNIHSVVIQVRGAVIQLATDRAWAFPLQEARDLVVGIARTEVAFFGSTPTDQITIMLAANEVTAIAGFDAYGLHTGSSVLVMLDPATNGVQLRENAASVIAHEMFHGWLGEAIPQTDPRTLWFTEGATTWFAARMLTAGGIWTPAHAREVLRDRLTRGYAQSPLLGHLSVAAAGAEVMAGADQVRYAYAGGVAACMALDRWLAGESGMMRPLDQVLRVLYDQHDGEPLSPQSLITVIRQVTGVDCTAWLDQHVYGTAALPPLDRLL